MSAKLIHKATVTGVASDHIVARLKADSTECEGCAIAHLCNKGETIDIPMKNPSQSIIGKEIVIEIASGTRHRAIVLMFVVPLLLLFATFGIGLWAGLGNLILSLIAIGVIALWYLCMYWLRPSTEKDIEYKLIDP